MPHSFTEAEQSTTSARLSLQCEGRMATYYLEDKIQPGEPGYTSRPSTINLGYQSWTLEPRSEYGGRRVFEVDDEKTFNRLKQNYPSLQAATDLIASNETAAVDAAVARAIEPITKRIEALENKTKRKRAPDP